MPRSQLANVVLGQRCDASSPGLDVGQRRDPWVVVGEQLQLVELQLHALDPSLEQRASLREPGEFGCGLIAHAPSLISASRHLLSPQIQRLPRSLARSFLAFEVGESFTEFGNPLSSCRVGLGQRCGPHFQTFAFRFTFGAGATHQVERFGVAGDTCLESLDIVQCGAFDPPGSFEVPLRRGPAALRP